MLENVKLCLSIDNDSQDGLLSVLLSNAINTICLYINVDVLPQQLEFIAVEMCINRFRRLGVEITSTEKIDVLSTTYFQQNDLRPYKEVLDSYKENNLGDRRVRFL